MSESPSGARVVVLGTAQDGGFPHAGCSCASCEAARADPSLRRRVASIGVVGATGRTLLVDATPDFGTQVADLGGRPDEILLTHAHVGHYVGLAMLGREVMDTKRLPLRCTASMERFLRGNRPWSHLVERREVEIQPVVPGEPIPFDGLTLQAFLSPHRGEDTDTIGILVTGPSRTVAYVPDADIIPPALADRLRAVDVALVDGTFYDRGELPHRDILEVRHPFVVESVGILSGGKGEVCFTHINHTNPLLHPDAARRPLLPRGFTLAAEGRVISL